MPNESQAPAEVIDFESSIETGVITKVAEPTEEEKVAAEAEKNRQESDKKKAEEEAKKSQEDEDGEEEEEEDEDLTDEEKAEKEAKEKTEKEKAEADKKKKADEEEDEGVSPDDFVKSEYFEKYEVENKKQLDELLETATEILAENEKLKKQIEEGNGKIKFADEHEAKAFELVKSFSNLAEGATAMATLIAMDVDKADAKSRLETQFILENPELSRDEAKEQFERKFKRKYTVKDKDKFDSEEDFEDAKKDAETDLKVDGERAKKFLKAKQEEVRTKSPEKKESEETKVPEVVQKSIERTASELTKYADGFKELIFSPTDDESDDFTFKLDAKQAKAVVNSAMNWVKNPAMYDQKGKFLGEFDPEVALRRTTYAMIGDEIFGGLVDHLHTLANIKRADEIGKKKPTEKSKAKGDVGDLNEYDQAEHLAKKKRIERSKIRTN